MGYQRSEWANVDSGEVVRLAAGGHKEAWDELHRRYSKMIARIARCAGCAAADLSDVQQAVWARLFQHIGRLNQPEAVAGWLAVVTKRECLRLAGKRPPTLRSTMSPRRAERRGAPGPGAAFRAPGGGASRRRHLAAPAPPAPGDDAGPPGHGL